MEVVTGAAAVVTRLMLGAVFRLVLATRVRQTPYRLQVPVSTSSSGVHDQKARLIDSRNVQRGLQTHLGSRICSSAASRAGTAAPFSITNGAAGSPALHMDTGVLHVGRTYRCFGSISVVRTDHTQTPVG